jgi:hypothetical protein
MRNDVRNEDLHLFASNLIEDRINFQNLSNDSPLGGIKSFPRSHFQLNLQEWKHFAGTFKVLVGHILLEFFPK